MALSRSFLREESDDDDDDVDDTLVAVVVRENICRVKERELLLMFAGVFQKVFLCEKIRTKKKEEKKVKKKKKKFSLLISV